jgi:transcriptional regulator with XRE-family HTH domain
MPKREELGWRIKKSREARGLTLKAVESAAGISATHVSEIERGKTSPTLGALLRIAGALGKDPAYFVEEEDLGDVSRVSVEDRVRESLPGGVGTMDRLTTSIPGGRLQARHLVLKPGAALRRERHQHGGNEAVLVLDGAVRVIVDDESVELTHGDSVHLDAGAPHAIENASRDAGASLIWVCSHRRAD